MPCIPRWVWALGMRDIAFQPPTGSTSAPMHCVTASQAKSWLTRPPSGRASSRTGTAGGASHSDAASNAAGPGAAAGGAGFATGVGTGSAAAAAPALYLTACLLPDMRELYVCHGAAVDEARLVEGLWDGLAAQVAWRREGSTQAA